MIGVLGIPTTARLALMNTTSSRMRHEVGGVDQ
jgi:hypothetical protein